MSLRYLLFRMCLCLCFSFLINVQIFAQDSTLIVGGEKVLDRNTAEYKHSVRLLVEAKFSDSNDVPEDIRGKSTGWRCSGVIIETDVVLTAAHCHPDTIMINYQGGQREVSVDINSIESFFRLSPRDDVAFGMLDSGWVRHESYQDDWLDRTSNVWNPRQPINDIALVFLSEAIPEDKEPVRWRSDLSNRFAPGQPVILTGYGRTLSTNPFELPELRKVTIPFIEDLQNNQEFYAGFGNSKNPRTITSPKGGCNGDSGGPAFINENGEYTLVGITVRGPGNQSGGCAASVTILTSVSDYVDWIGKRISRFSSDL